MQTPHQCPGCLSRRHCRQIFTTAAGELAFSREFFPALAKSSKAGPDFVARARLRPGICQVEGASTQEVDPLVRRG
jgi:hypothetical protein